MRQSSKGVGVKLSVELAMSKEWRGNEENAASQFPGLTVYRLNGLIRNMSLTIVQVYGRVSVWIALETILNDDMVSSGRHGPLQQ